MRQYWLNELNRINYQNTDKIMEVYDKTEKYMNSGKDKPDFTHLTSEEKEIITRLNRCKPLSPLTLNEDEWNEVTNGVYQSARQPNVFKDYKGVYCLEGLVGKDEDGNFHYTIKVEGIKYDSKAYVKNLGFTDTIVLDTDKNGVVLDKSQLEKVYKYYEVIKCN